MISFQAWQAESLCKPMFRACHSFLIAFFVPRITVQAGMRSIRDFRMLMLTHLQRVTAHSLQEPIVVFSVQLITEQTGPGSIPALKIFVHTCEQI